jgi:ubiquinone/menaquinone biosynthesis C-methylase UbiE
LKDPKKMKFDEIADTGSDTYHHEPQLSFALDAVRGARVLNIGCWTGNFESLAVEYAASVTGLDIEPMALEVARSNVPGAEFIEGSVFEMPFADGSFGAVTMFEVVEHIPVGTEQQAFGEIARVLEPGGALMLTTPSWTLRSRLLDPAYLLTGHRHYRARDIIAMLVASGLTTERSEVRGGWVYVASYLTFYLYKHVLHRPMPQPDWLIRSYLRDTQSPGFTTMYFLARKDIDDENACEPLPGRREDKTED